MGDIRRESDGLDKPEPLINNRADVMTPQGNTVRAQVAAILMRFIENIAK